MTLEQALAINAELREQLAARDAIIAELQTRVAELERRLGERDDENQVLTEKVNQDSQNSSKPPSSDPPWKPKSVKDKKKAKRKRGGQKGHKGHHRQLLPASQVDHVHPYLPSVCKHCDTPLSGDPVGLPHRVQVTELPKVQVEVHEHQAHALRCACGAVTRATLPERVTQSAFGPRLTATVALLTSSYRLSKRQLVSLLSLFGTTVSASMITRMERRVGKALKPVYEQAKDVIRAQQGPLHVDETLWKQQGKRIWMWVVSSEQLRVFRIAKGRTTEVAKQLIDGFKGILCTDRFGGYRFYPMHRRQVCWSHLKRDFTAFLERRDEDKALGEALLREVSRMFMLFHNARDGTISRERFRHYMRPVQARILRQLRQGRRCACKKTAGTCREVLKYRKALWTFVRHVEVAPTNNQAERDLRHPVILRRVSHGTQSHSGSRFLERMLTVVASLKAQDRDVMDFLMRVLDPPHFGAAPSLIPTASPKTSTYQPVTLLAA